jgi:hypothetical protein
MPLFMDNEAAIVMINEHKPTTCSHHIDIQHDNIVMHHIPGIINPSDQATKALGWTLHSRHAHQSMGHYQPE